MYLYHYHAQIQEQYGSTTNIDGLLATVKPILDMEGYRNAKQTICTLDGGLLDSRKLIICSLSLLDKEHPGF